MKVSEPQELLRALLNEAIFCPIFAFFRFPKIGNHDGELTIEGRRANTVYHAAFIRLV